MFFIGSIALSVVAVYISQKHKKSNLKKYLGANLYSWTEKKELTNGIYKYLMIIVGAIIGILALILAGLASQDNKKRR